MKNKKMTIVVLSILIIAIAIVSSISLSSVKAVDIKHQGTYGRYLTYGPYSYQCGYSAISVGLVGDEVIEGGKGGLVDLDGSALSLRLGFVSCLNDIYDNTEGIISIKIYVSVYDHTTNNYICVSQVLSGSSPVYEKDEDGDLGTKYDMIYKAASFVIGKINPAAGAILTVLGFIKSPGGISSSVSGSIRKAVWRAESGPFYAVDYDHMEITWDGLITGLSESHSYEVTIESVICHTGNIDYGLDSVSYNFFVNSKPSTSGGGGGGGCIPPKDTIC
ncbi:MAG: hypothetical protein GF308_22005 [Candidatus Heimdallarchaeota archaeon]|nr:hypothetical protein [Candidatus Heimdallarchaeota archaeon]